MATDVSGLEVVISEDAVGEDIILEGVFESVLVDAEDVTIYTQGNTTIGEITVGQNGIDSTITLNMGTVVEKMVLDSKSEVKGNGTVKNAEVNADGVSFEKLPEKQTGSNPAEEQPTNPPDTSGGNAGDSNSYNGGSPPNSTPQDVELSGLTENLAADFSPAFSPDTYAYTLAAAHDEDVQITPTLAGATITWDVDNDFNNAVVVNSGETAEIRLNWGENIITIHVEKAGTKAKDYIITVNKAKGSISYNGGFTERVENDGRFTDKITVTLNGCRFNSDLLTEDGYTVQNLPEGLDLIAHQVFDFQTNQFSDTQAEITLSGTAVNHHPDNSINNLTLIFHDSAFRHGDADLITNSTKDDLSLTFIDTPMLTFQIDTPVDDAIDVPNNTSFVLRFDESIVNVEPVQGGLNIVNSATDQVYANLFSQDTTKNINDKTFTFTYDHFRFWPNTSYYVKLYAGTFSDGSAYSAGVTDKTNWTFTTQPASLSYSSDCLTERGQNDGRFEEVITVTLSGDAFDSSLEDDALLNEYDNSCFTASDVPAGLTLRIYKVDDTHLEIELFGIANSHLPADNIDDLSITFTDKLFQAGRADLVSGISRDDLSITFVDE